MSNTKETVVLYPSMGVGHVNPMVELAKQFLRRRVDVIIAVMNKQRKAPTSNDAIAPLIAANPSISFHLLPPISNPTISDVPTGLMDTGLNNTNLAAFLRSLPSVFALVLDMFCVDALDVAKELGIPAYFYFTSGAADLAVFLQVPYLDQTIKTSFKDMGKTLLHLSGVPPIRASDMVQSLQERNNGVYKERVYQFSRLPEAKGILINSYEWLELNAVQAIRDGACLVDGSNPPVYCIGPLVNSGDEKATEERHACLPWLDAQPKQSVVFLCFGSRGNFSAAQLREMANGLESSGQRFLWVVRSPSNDGQNLEELLPEGFLERTKDRGMVVKSWAPQAEVLRHEAVGAFVTHCGWNSILEAITAAMPMVCWPLYAEQRLNKVFMVEEMRIGVEMKGYDEELVKAEEVEAKVKLVLESDEGQELRKRLVMAKEQGAKATKEGGSSWVAFTEFLMDVEKENGNRK